MLNELIQANEIVFKNTKVQVLGMTLMLNRTISNISKSYSTYIDYKQKN